jgi:hypothetical protein
MRSGFHSTISIASHKSRHEFPPRTPFTFPACSARHLAPFQCTKHAVSPAPPSLRRPREASLF